MATERQRATLFANRRNHVAPADPTAGSGRVQAAAAAAGAAEGEAGGGGFGEGSIRHLSARSRSRAPQHQADTQEFRTHDRSASWGAGNQNKPIGACNSVAGALRGGWPGISKLPFACVGRSGPE